MRSHGITFHHLHSDAHPMQQGSVSADQLDRVIDRVGAHRICPARQWLERTLAGKTPAGAVVLTFDDTLRCQFDIALPVLEARGIEAFFFVNTSVLEGNIERLEVYRRFRTTQFESVECFYDAFESSVGRRKDAPAIFRKLDAINPASYLPQFDFYSDADRRFRYLRDEILGPQRYAKLMDRMMEAAAFDVRDVAADLWMTADQVRQLDRRGHVVGLHSHTHPTRMDRLGPSEVRYEWRCNHRALETLLGEPPVVMAHPGNAYTDQSLSVLRELNVRVGFRNDTRLQSSSPLELPREDVNHLLGRIAA